jgi:hypothetical protein
MRSAPGERGCGGVKVCISEPFVEPLDRTMLTFDFETRAVEIMLEQIQAGLASGLVVEIRR